LPNGVTLRLECGGQDATLVSVMIETLGRCDVPARR
jgi:transposase